MINFYDQVGRGISDHYNPNGDKYLIKHPFRALISGVSGSGKTNALLNLISKLNCWDRYYLYVKLMGDDPLYDEVLVPKLQAVGKKHTTDILMEYSATLDDLPAVETPAAEGGINSD